MIKIKMLAAAVFGLLLAAGCASYNSGYSYPYNHTYDISGTVDSVDLNSQSIYLTNAGGFRGYSNLVPYGSGNNVRVFYNNGTVAYWQGRAYRPEDLEHGDQVTIHVTQTGNQLIAQSMNVTYNSREGMASSAPPYGSYGYNTSLVHGTLSSVDNYARTMTIDTGNGNLMTVSFNSNTPVYMNGRTFLPTELQAGDTVDVRVNDLGRGNLGAQDITVIQGTTANGAYGSSMNALSTIRGTVQYVDANTHTIALDSPVWISGPLTNPGTSMIIEWNPSSQINFQGQLYPVTNLQQGDVVDVQLQDLGGGNLLAQQISVYHDVNAH